MPFFGYNQIRIAPEDKENKAFIIKKCIYYYKVMLFDLKNAGATYRGLVNKIFKDQIMQNMKVYVNDVLVKSSKESDHMQDLEEAFGALQ